MFEKYVKDDVLFIVPYPIRETILQYLAKKKELYRISFLSLEEFLSHYFFEINQEEALAFLYEKTKIPLSILKEKLSLLYFIDPKKKYQNKKLQELQELYKTLEENHFLQKDASFQNVLQKYQVYVIGYPYLEKYQEKALKECNAPILSYDKKLPLPKVYAFSSLEEEISFVAGKMKALHQKGISYQKMRLANVVEEDIYLIEQIFHHFQIPLVGLKKYPLSATEVVKKYIHTLDSSVIKDPAIRSQIVRVENQLLPISKEKKVYKLLLKEILKTVYLDCPSYVEAVRVVDFYHLMKEDDVYTFVIGFNQNQLPKVVKDEAYLSDNDLIEVDAYPSSVQTQKYKKMTIAILKSIPNLVLSYRRNTLSGFVYPSSLIEEEKMEVVSLVSVDYRYSKSYSMIRAGEMLDVFYTYGEKHPDLDQLLVTFPHLPYRCYQHRYHRVPFQIPANKPFYLSYTSLNDYALCKFRYYANNILKLDSYEQSFSATLGSIYHDVLTHIYDVSFDFEERWEEAVQKFTLSKKEQVLLKRLKKELAFIIPVIEEQDSKSAFTKRLFEQKIEIPLGDHVFLKGFVDKIAFCELYGKIHYVIYDYKTGNVTLDLNHIDEGLFLQLPIYRVLIEKGKLFQNPHFTGFFYQQLLLPSKTQQQKIQNLKLRGYVVDDEESLSIFDETYENSEVIKGLKVTQNGYAKQSKILSEEESESLVNRTYQQIVKMKNEILQGDFAINPKKLKNNDISCKNCPFKDVCFRDEKDFIMLDDTKEVKA